MVYPIGHLTLPKISVGGFLVRSVQSRAHAGNDFNLILMVKMETRHPVRRIKSFGTEFPAICNHCVVRPEVARRNFVRNFCIFLEERPLKVLVGKFSPPHRSMLLCLCSNFVKFGRREIGEIVQFTGQ